jgi:hypothetical protein
VLFIVLLGYCCGGKNYFPERALQKHFPLAEAFSLARGYNVPDSVKLRDAFYAFLAFVYEVLPFLSIIVYLTSDLPECGK